MIIRFIAKLLAVLNSNKKPFQVGAGIAFGLLLALVPTWNLTFAAILIVVLFVARVHLGITIVSTILFSLIVPAFDGALNRLGLRVLTLPGLQEIYARAFEIPVVALTRFNNTLVAGSLVSGIVLWTPVAFLAVLLVRLYRKHIHARIANSKIVKAFMATPFAQRVMGAMRKFQAIWPTAG
jgi:uncharacterized protein (TIGR03546 family)